MDPDRVSGEREKGSLVQLTVCIVLVVGNVPSAGLSHLSNI